MKFECYMFRYDCAEQEFRLVAEMVFNDLSQFDQFVTFFYQVQADLSEVYKFELNFMSEEITK